MTALAVVAVIAMLLLPFTAVGAFYLGAVTGARLKAGERPAGALPEAFSAMREAANIMAPAPAQVVSTEALETIEEQRRKQILSIVGEELQKAV